MKDNTSVVTAFLLGNQLSPSSRRNDTKWTLSVATASKMTAPFDHRRSVLDRLEHTFMNHGYMVRPHASRTTIITGSSPIPIRPAPVTGSTLPSTSTNRLQTYDCTRNSAPRAGSTYIIVEKSTGRALAFGCPVRTLRFVTSNRLRIYTGPPQLTLNPVPGLSFNDPDTEDFVCAVTFPDKRPWLWHCKASEGWLAFQNHDTGVWLGQHNMEYGPRHHSGHHSGYSDKITSGGRFCIKREAGGQNYLLTKNFRAERRKRGVMESIEFDGYDKDGNRMVDRRIAGTNTGGKFTTWEFVKVTAVPETNT